MFVPLCSSILCACVCVGGCGVKLYIVFSGFSVLIQVSLPMSLTPSQQSHMAVAQPPPLVRVTGAPPSIG
jgi:hypothetical protein